MTNKKHVYCFDLDGTLLDHGLAVRNAVEDIRKHFTCFVESDSDEFFQAWNRVSEKYMDLYLDKKLSFTEQREARVREIFNSYGQKITAWQATSCFDLFLSRYEANWCLFDDVQEVLGVLQRDFVLGMITNGDAEQQRKKFERFELEKYFNHLVISGKFGISKPNKEIFEHFATLAETAPEQCVYIGDKKETDAVAASEAGFVGVWLNRKSAEQSTRVRTIHSLSELLQSKGLLHQTVR